MKTVLAGGKVYLFSCGVTFSCEIGKHICLIILFRDFGFCLYGQIYVLFNRRYRSLGDGCRQLDLYIFAASCHHACRCAVIALLVLNGCAYHIFIAAGPGNGRPIVNVGKRNIAPDVICIWNTQAGCRLLYNLLIRFCVEQLLFFIFFCNLSL